VFFHFPLSERLTMLALNLPVETLVMSGAPLVYQHLFHLWRRGDQDTDWSICKDCNAPAAGNWHNIYVLPM